MSEICIQDLSFSYEKNGKIFPALHDVNLTVERGEFVCILGHSGCGKSTLLRLLQGLLTPSGGRILLRGQPVTGPGSDRAIVFQQYSLFPWMRAKKQVMFGVRHAAARTTRQEAARIAEEMLDRVGMLPYQNRYPNQLSGGMQQRVAIARALAMNPEILLLDEPFGALDAKRRTQLQQLLLELWSRDETRKTIVFVTHDVDEAILLADRIVFMSHGTAAQILPLPYPRPRSPELLQTCAEARELKAHIMELFDRDETDETI